MARFPLLGILVSTLLVLLLEVTKFAQAEPIGLSLVSDTFSDGKSGWKKSSGSSTQVGHVHIIFVQPCQPS